MKRVKTINDHIDNTIKVNDCWIWNGSVDSRGYGQLRSNGKTWRAHRFFYSELVGQIPSRYQIDHVCRNKLCVNPDHLEAVTQTENIRRSGAWDVNKTKTHCPAGHEYSDSNTLSRNNKRTCLICKRERSKKYMQEKRLTNKNLSC